MNSEASPSPETPNQQRRRESATNWQTIRRVTPYIINRKSVLIFAFVLMAGYSLGLNLRNIIPAIFFDGVLTPELASTSGSLTTRYVRPLTAWLEDEPQQDLQEPYKQSGQYLNLSIILDDPEKNTLVDQKRLSEGELSFENGSATYRWKMGSEEIPFSNIRFTSLRLKFDPTEDAQIPKLDPNTNSWQSSQGVLGLEFKPMIRTWGLLRFVIIFGLINSVLIAVCRFGQSYLVGSLVQNILADLRRDMISHMTDLSLAFFDERSRGDLLSRVSADLSMISSSLNKIFSDLVQKPLMLIIAIVVIFIINWWLALITICFFPILFVILIKFGRKVRRRSKKQSTKRGMMTVALEQLFSGIRTVKSFAMEKFEKEHFEERNRDVVKEEMKTLRARVASSSLVEFAANTGVIVAIGIGGYFLIGDKLGMSLGDLIVFTGALNTMYMPVKSLARAYSTFQESLGAMERVIEIFETYPSVVEAEGATDLAPFKDSIQFDKVCFSYGRETVLEDVDLTIPSGKLTAIVGPTGAGKSTLVDLILRFYDTDSGAIKIDGVDIKSVNLPSLISQISIVSQEPFLFDTTIRNNILYGNPDASQEEIEEASRMANIHDFIVSLPEGYETKIGDRGTRLSGGQRQRITIARALLKNAPILILDEATSNLDAESEAQVQEALDRLIHLRSTIAIAHRLSTIKDADQIVVLEDGRVAEIGKFEELLEQKGLFHRLYEKQYSRK